MDKVLTTINALKSTTKKAERIQIIQQADTNFHIVAYLAMNPYIKFNRRHIMTEVDPSTENPNIDDLLEALLQDVEHNTDMKIRGLLFDKFCDDLFERTGSHHIANIISSGDLDCGLGAKLFNEAKVGITIPVFELAKASEAAKLDKLPQETYGNLKIDGQRCLVTVYEDLTMDFQTSSGNYLQQTDRIENEIKQRIFENNLTDLVPFQFDAELCQFDGKEFIDRGTSGGVVTKMRHGNATDEELDLMKIFVFDILQGTRSHVTGDKRPLRTRLIDLKRFEREGSNFIRLVEYVELKSHEEAMEYTDMLVQLKQEGSVIKDPNSPWLPKRMSHWVKIKAFATCDCKVVGWTPHSKDDELIGSLIISSSDGKITSGVGTGHWLTEERRRHLMTMAEDGYLESGDMILEVRSFVPTTNKKTGAWSFNIPSIMCQREDKVEADDFNKIMDMFPALKGKY